MDFIFMLTRGDRTVGDGLALLERIAGLGLRHIGFKDIGADRAMLRALNRRVGEMGATSYLEVVSTSTEACLDSVRAAVDIGVDRLLGGTEVTAVLDILKGTDIAYYPFPGFPEGHPTNLRGSAADVAAHCADFMAQGCAGVDLLAYRATEADPLALVRAARRALGDGWLIVAGSIASAAQIADLARAGADAFTIGTAVFEDAFAADAEGVVDQIRAVQAACAASAPAT